METINYNWNEFWNNYRNKLGPIRNKKTVEVVEKLVSYCIKKGLSNRQIAYILATCYHETAFDFIPKYEFGSISYFVRRYWLNSKVAKWLGNDDAKDAFECRGRGLIQITGENNYEYFGIRDNPDKALEIDTAIRIAVDGMIKGVFTGKKLSDYVNTFRCDFYNARRVVNGLDKAQKISNYANMFLTIL